MSATSDPIPSPILAKETFVTPLSPAQRKRLSNDDTSDDGSTMLQRKRKATEAETLSPLVSGTESTLRQNKRLDREKKKLERKNGAIIAPSRTAEGFKISAGKQQSCMTDAIENAMKMDGVSEEQIPSARMRKIAIPQLGNVLQASWESCSIALETLDLPYKLKRVTAQFQGGPPMLNLLNAVSGLFIVGMAVHVSDTTCKRNNHCVAFSADKGMLMDNGSNTRPVYIEETDKCDKKTAKKAFRLLVEQKLPKGTTFSVDVTSVYELCRL